MVVLVKGVEEVERCVTVETSLRWDWYNSNVGRG